MIQSQRTYSWGVVEWEKGKIDSDNDDTKKKALGAIPYQRSARTKAMAWTVGQRTECNSRGSKLVFFVDEY